MSAEPVLARRWQPVAGRPEQERELVRALRLRPLTARVLVGRALGEPAQAERFLNPRLSDLRPPEGLPDLDRALARLVRALADNEPIGVFGDYDVDGVVSAAILTEGLRALGARVVTRVATRSAGYGLGPAEAARFCDDGCRVVVTADCGTSDYDALSLLAGRGVDAVVIDHHQVPARPSAAHALINPHRVDNRFPFKYLASCGIAFYLVAALRTRQKEAGRPGAGAWDPRSVLDLVALGTIADVVPLREENRILVAAGLRELSRLRRPGIRALARKALVDGAAGLDATTVSFRFAPRINAAGRLGDAARALDLLLANADVEAEACAVLLEEINKQRQRIQEEVLVAAVEQAESLRRAEPHLPALVVGGQGWHPGVVGIVAAKLVDRFACPALVVGFTGEVGRGSARTVPGYDLFQLLGTVREHLEAFGGHAMAAGLTVRWAAFANFQRAFVDAVAAVGSTIETGYVHVDAVAELRELDLEGVIDLLRLGPFGAENRAPLLALPGVTAASHRLIGGRQHLQLALSQGHSTGDAIGFGMAAHVPASGARIDVLGTPEISRFQGRQNARVRIHEWSLAEDSA